MKSVPSHCPKCCVGLVETPDGRVPNFYGRLVFPTDPPNQKCINCGTVLVPVLEDLSQPLAVAA